MADLKMTIKKLWQKFFSDPSQWWDNRSEKVSAGYPDFKHKMTNEGLWLDGKSNPPWVEAQLSAIDPDTLQSDIFTWNKRLTRCVKVGEYEKTIKLFQLLQQEGLSPNKFTFVPLLSACASLRALTEGRCFHSQIIRNGFESDMFLSSSLVHMYTKCGSVEDAERVFNKMPNRDLVTWNAMLLGYVKCGQGLKALELFQRLQLEGVEPDSVTFVGMLNACAAVAAVDKGRLIHDQIILRQWESDVFISSSLIDMYVKCGSIEDALTVFNKMPICNVFAWTAMILGYVKHKQGRKALELFYQMQQKGVKPTSVTFVGALNACACVPTIEEGRRIHEQIIQRGWESNVFIGSCLVDMYAKCGSIGDAWTVFKKMPVCDVVAWTAMIQGYVTCGQGQKALELFQQMQRAGLETNPVTFTVVLNACASVAALEEGRCVHEWIIRSGWDADVFLNSCLIDMYAKCGSMHDAQQVFDKMPVRNVVSWNALIGAYAMHGEAAQALRLFEQMRQEGVKMDAVTFVSLLSACSHGGLADEGLQYLDSMSSVYNISATLEHYACITDLLARAGRLDEAEHLVKSMFCETDTPIWMSLLGACRVHGNVEMGERITKQLLELDPGNRSAYVLLSSIYATAGKWDRSANVQRLKLELGVKGS